MMMFQFTHPGGVRLYCCHVLEFLSGFNSRTREGCDTSVEYSDKQDVTFQFTHPGGVRPHPNA